MRQASTNAYVAIVLLLALGVTAAIGAPAPKYEWQFDKRSVTGNQVKASLGGLDGTLSQTAVLSADPAYLSLSGDDYVTAVPKGARVNLPESAITVEAWVALRETQRWGGYVGYVQDNGSFEKGWVLGNYEDRFSFALSSEGADDGDGTLTYLKADRPVELYKWAHLVGTYDGKELKVYVNGRLAATSTAQSGPISYSDAQLVIGAYKDDDESFAMDGGIARVRIYDAALTPEQVGTRFERTRGAFAKAPQIPVVAQLLEPVLIDGPWATFEDQNAATIHWSTEEPMPSILEIAESGRPSRRLGSSRETRDHAVRVSGLRRNTVYTYTMWVRTPNGEETTEEFLLDTQFDYTMPPVQRGRHPYPKDRLSARYAGAAAHILRESGIDRGYCIDYGCGDGRLAYAIARRSKLQVVGVSTDADAVKRGRARLLATGDYGTRVTLRHVESLDDLPFPDLCANLIVSGEALSTGTLPGTASEVFAKLRPQGGKAFLGTLVAFDAPLTRDDFDAWARASVPENPEGTPADGLPETPGLDLARDVRIQQSAEGLWAVLQRSRPLPGAGNWTHAYGDAGQSANSHDERVYGKAGETLEVQWFGLPGPNAMVDRLARKQGPLSTAGRLFTLGNDRIIAQDAYNGTIIWSVELPGLLRNNIPRNTGNACANDASVFVAMRDRCWQFDAAGGERRFSYDVDEGRPGAESFWAYVATAGDLLFGSAVRRGNFETEYRAPKYWFDGKSGRDTQNVCGENLFANKIDDGRRVWTYTGGLIINSTISMGNGRMYFLESRSQAALESPLRRLGAELWSDVWLVCLDAATGGKRWEQKYEHPTAPIVVYLVYDHEQVGVVSSHDGAYDVRTWDASQGKALWQATDKWRSDNHGHHIQHPVIAQGKMFQEPHVYDWKTGEKLDIAFPGRSKCGTVTAAANALHYRDFNDEVWDLNAGTQSEFSKLRSGCWIGMISGSGLLMSPESAGGCGCRWPIYTSLTYRAKDDY